MKGLKDTPNYSIMPLGGEWREEDVIRKEREQKLLHLTKGTNFIHSTLGTIDSVTKLKRGEIKIQKKIFYIANTELLQEKFHIIHYVDWKVGRCFQLSSGRDFLFPMNIDILKNIFIRRIDGTKTKLYESWAECKGGIVRIITLPSNMEKRFSFQKLFMKCRNRTEALGLVKQKSVWTFSSEILTQEPVFLVQPKVPQNTKQLF